MPEQIENGMLMPPAPPVRAPKWSRVCNECGTRWDLCEWDLCPVCRGLVETDDADEENLK